jgi:hypothetical protein
VKKARSCAVIGAEKLELHEALFPCGAMKREWKVGPQGNLTFSAAACHRPRWGCMLWALGEMLAALADGCLVLLQLACSGSLARLGRNGVNGPRREAGPSAWSGEPTMIIPISPFLLYPVHQPQSLSPFPHLFPPPTSRKPRTPG